MARGKLRVTNAACAGMVGLLLTPAVSAPLHAQEPVCVGSATARIAIPIGRATEALWVWHDTATIEGRAEYRWAMVTRGDSAHAVGFMLFKLHSRGPQQGSFATLLRAGQVQI